MQGCYYCKGKTLILILNPIGNAKETNLSEEQHCSDFLQWHPAVSSGFGDRLRRVEGNVYAGEFWKEDESLKDGLMS